MFVIECILFKHTSYLQSLGQCYSHLTFLPPGWIMIEAGPRLGYLPPGWIVIRAGPRLGYLPPGWIVIGAGPRLGLGLGHRQTQPIDALVLALAEVRFRS